MSGVCASDAVSESEVCQRIELGYHAGLLLDRRCDIGLDRAV